MIALQGQAAARSVAVIQSNYIPWKGYFDIIHDVDTFIFLDDVQFTARDWRSRNQIKTQAGVQWLTIPVGPGLDRLIHEVRLVDSRWQRKHWATIVQNYGKAPYFEHYRAFFEHFYLGSAWSSLSEFNQALTKAIATQCLGLRTQFRDSREFTLRGKKLDRLVDLILQAGATEYLSGPTARDYIDKSVFDRVNVNLTYKDYAGYPEYPQRYDGFAHGVSIIDVLFNVGPDAPHYIWGWRQGK